jgi:hypothetical protein
MGKSINSKKYIAYSIFNGVAHSFILALLLLFLIDLDPVIKKFGFWNSYLVMITIIVVTGGYFSFKYYQHLTYTRILVSFILSILALIISLLPIFFLEGLVISQFIYTDIGVNDNNGIGFLAMFTIVFYILSLILILLINLVAKAIYQVK